jgi:hypothetical protein
VAWWKQKSQSSTWLEEDAAAINAAGPLLSSVEGTDNERVYLVSPSHRNQVQLGVAGKASQTVKSPSLRLEVIAIPRACLEVSKVRGDTLPARQQAGRDLG